MSNAAVKITTEFKSPTDVGVHHRLVCMTGPNKGKVYYLLGKRIIIGRSDSADIQIIDSKISREHAEITFTGEGYNITDLGSPNGIIINDLKIVQKKILDGEKIIIGQSVFKYNIIQVSEANNILTVTTGDKKIIKPKLVIKHDTEEPRSFVNEVTEDDTDKKKGPKLIVIIALIGLGAYILLGEGDNNKKKVEKPTGIEENLFNNIGPDSSHSNKKLSMEDSEIESKFISILQQGQREVREKNYFRAIENFERAQQLIPNNGRASYYLDKAKQKLKDEIKNNFIKGNKEFESKKYSEATASFCAIEKLLQFYPNDERYINAAANLSAIESQLKQEPGEIKCFEEKPAD